MTNLIEEKHDIPVDNGKIYLKSSIYYSETTPKKASFLINMPGLTEHRESKFVKYITETFAKEYYILVYDYRAHGETAQQTGKNIFKHVHSIFSDVRAVIKWVKLNQKKRILNDNVILFGRSFGGAIILTHGYLDEDAKFLISLCTRYDYATYTDLKFSEDIINYISPKYYLRSSSENNKRILIAHCKDDERIPFSNLEKIQEKLALDEKNVIIYEDGGHAFRGHRDDLAQKVIEFLKRI